MENKVVGLPLIMWLLILLIVVPVLISLFYTNAITQRKLDQVLSTLSPKPTQLIKQASPSATLAPTPQPKVTLKPFARQGTPEGIPVR